MDNFNKLDEPVISSSGRKRKIKAETFSQNLAKAARYSGEGKSPCILCNHNNKVCQASMSAEEINVTKINQVFY
jgi:hypothetical protein